VEWVKTATDVSVLLPSYTRTLKGLLNLHARVLTVLNRDAEARAKSDEAARL
jgi:hypothetical protein